MNKEDFENLKMVFAMAIKDHVNNNPDRQGLLVILTLEEKVNSLLAKPEVGKSVKKV